MDMGLLMQCVWGMEWNGQIRRIHEAQAKGFRHIMFDDNFIPGEKSRVRDISLRINVE